MFLYSEARILYIIAVVAAFFPVFIGYRLGLKLVRVEKPDVRQTKSHKWFIPAGGLILFSLLFGYYTRDWINVVIGIIIGLIVWAFFYRFSRNEEKGKE
jgi:membrane protease YdiL (CAAX protease family)